MENNYGGKSNVYLNLFIEKDDQSQTGIFSEPLVNL